MNDSEFKDQVPLSIERQIDQVCDHFERQWESGEHPRIEDYLSRAAEGSEMELLRELIAVELEMRRAAGETPDRTEYEGRFEQFHGAIEWAFRQSGPAGDDSVEATISRRHDSTDRDAQTQVSSGVASAKRIGRYEIIRVLGKGGFGVVYLARDPDLDRLVALKMILEGADAPQEYLDRFQNEAESVARLQHPNIVNIFEVGRIDGLPYLALEYVEGGTLASSDPLPAADAAALVETVARAVQFAHDNDIVHRDLKPANILRTTDGVPKITDFGLAKRLDNDSTQTQSGRALGTPSYMAPEQARGDVGAIGPPADVYAIGAVLYAFLTGRPPFVGAKLLDTLDMVCKSEPVPPSQLVAKVPRDLETICLKCLQKEPTKRYASAGELADDVRRFRDGRPILARPVGSLERVWRWARRNPWMATAASLVLVIAVVSSVLSWWLNVARNDAVTATALAQDQTRIAKRNETIAIAEKELAGEQCKASLDVIRGVVTRIDRALSGRPELMTVRDAVIRVTKSDFEKVINLAKGHRLELKGRTEAGIQARIGQVSLAFGEVEQAATRFADAAEILENVAKNQPRDPVNVRNLANMHNLRAELELRRGNTRKARDLYLAGLELRQKWLQMVPDWEAAKHAIAKSYGYLGKVNMLLGDTNEALREYMLSEQQYAGLTPAYAKTEFGAEVPREHAALQQHLGEIAGRLGQLDKAEQHLTDALHRREDLARANENVHTYRDMALSHLAMGDFYLRDRGDLAKAWQQYQPALSLFEQIGSSSSVPLEKNLITCRDLAAVHYRIGVVLESAARDDVKLTDKDEKAGAHFQRALELRQVLAKAGGDDAPHDMQTQIELGLALARCGKYDEAEKIAQACRDKGSKNNDQRMRFQAACIYSICAQSDDAELAKRCQTEALSMIKKMIESSWKDQAALNNDPDLDCVRASTEFQTLLQAFSN